MLALLNTESDVELEAAMLADEKASVAPENVFVFGVVVVPLAVNTCVSES